MKISKTGWLLITAWIFILILATLGINSFQRVSERNQLNEKLILAKSNLEHPLLEDLSSQETELKEQLSQYISQYEAAKATVYQPVGNSAAIGILFDAAKAHGLEVTDLSSSGPTTENLGRTTFSVISLTAKVEGDIGKLVNFTVKLKDYFTTGVVKSIQITMPETTNGDKASADVHMVIYMYRGD
ncbi:hypothetical protein ACFLTG_02515 [Chloroflexota bacterium]